MGEESADNQSKCNPKEAEWAVAIASGIRQMTGASICILSFYKAQVQLVLKMLPKGIKGVEVCTVDSFQGKESDVVVLSCVRSSVGVSLDPRLAVGFVADPRRINVALTRAR